MTNHISILILGVLLLSVFGCSNEPSLDTNNNSNPIDFSDTDFNLNFDYVNIDYPIHYDNGVLNDSNEPNNNVVNNPEANLGRLLFYDVNLSINNTTSCASCHLQSNGFTDPDRLSTGHGGGLTGAHSMRLGNISFFEPGSMFWDKRAETLEEQVLLPIQDPVEMGFDANNGGLNALTDKLQNTSYYGDIFNEVYGDPEVTINGISRSLAQFVRSMVSIDSEFDRGFAQVFQNGGNNGINNNFPNFSASENRGKALFLGRAGCDRCHNEVTFALEANSDGNGLDAGETTVFKSPSLKNVAIIGPYMHDGRFNTLEEVIEHYDNGIQPGPALDNRLRDGPNGTERLNLSNQDKEDLVAFLQTLTDESLISDAKFSNPFDF